VVLAVARSRRPRLRLPVPAATVLVTGGVAASIAGTVILLRREPAAAQYLPPPSAGYLAAVLAGCLWIALGSPRWLGTSRLAPHLGAAAAVVFAAWFWLAIRTDGTEPPLPVVLPSAPTCPRPWSSASASFPCLASRSGDRRRPWRRSRHPR